ncbi:MAG TPA: hypothetical protein VNG29_03300 [Candidatus Paceibacterota bacterium]|nr:hypothetical protein [Candidatus Paceibacterota bacterium]
MIITIIVLAAIVTLVVFYGSISSFLKFDKLLRVRSSERLGISDVPVVIANEAPQPIAEASATVPPKKTAGYFTKKIGFARGDFVGYPSRRNGNVIVSFMNRRLCRGTILLVKGRKAIIQSDCHPAGVTVKRSLARLSLIERGA